ncbi:MAG: gamma-glutamylcyclotransferase family protein [bacterium]
MMSTVFFYGLFMDPELLRSENLNPRNIEIAYVKDHQLVIGQRASLIAKQQARAFGTIMNLDNAEITKLYAGDGLDDYTPHKVMTSKVNGESIEAITYILPSDKLVGSNNDYARELASVAEKVGLPASYINEIKRWIENQ